MEDIKKQGLGLAAISYDSEAILRSFTEKHLITFPLLSDVGSKTIDAWGLRNREATGRTAGIPYPGTYVIDRSGVIVSRAFEDAYQERDTAASILASLRPPASLQGTPDIVGKYLIARTSVSDRVAAPGHRVSLLVEIVPGKNVHVYAPGQRGYIPIAVTLDPSPDFKIGAARYPVPTDYVFGQLKEHVKVFDRPSRIMQDVTLALTPSLRQRAAAKDTLSVSGTLEYQACDDKVCFRPESIRLTWSIALTPIER